MKYIHVEIVIKTLIMYNYYTRTKSMLRNQSFNLMLLQGERVQIQNSLRMYQLYLILPDLQKKKRKADQNLVHYEAAKRKRQYRDNQANNDGQNEVENGDVLGKPSAALQCKMNSIEVQTDMTMDDLAALEHTNT